ncbi:MAG TPA: hypothetical protein VMA72_02790 [Streptosporangiaceae bacterium]|nr:hypothetical protein [Streptosporangiaceae bacterium]
MLRGPHLVAKVDVGAAGRFTVKVPGGSYVLAGVPSWRGRPQQASCAARHVITVVSGEVTSVDVDCHYVGAAPG